MVADHRYSVYSMVGGIVLPFTHDPRNDFPPVEAAPGCGRWLPLIVLPDPRIISPPRLTHSDERQYAETPSAVPSADRLRTLKGGSSP